MSSYFKWGWGWGWGKADWGTVNLANCSITFLHLFLNLPLYLLLYPILYCCSNVSYCSLQKSPAQRTVCWRWNWGYRSSPIVDRVAYRTRRFSPSSLLRHPPSTDPRPLTVDENLCPPYTLGRPTDDNWTDPQ